MPFPVLFFLLFLSIPTLSHAYQWSTFRPNSLISLRASVPHSPHFGFVYHQVSSENIRHVVTDHLDKIKAVSWDTHNLTFGDQVIHDQDANLVLITSFLQLDEGCVIRVSAKAWDPTKPVEDISVIYYAATGPEDLSMSNEHAEDPSLWGTIAFDHNSRSNPENGVRVNGNAKSIGGSYTLKLHPPRSGAITDAPPALRQLSGESSRSQRRTRGDKPPDNSPLYAFHLATSPHEPRIAWAVEHAVKKLLKLEHGVQVLKDEISDNSPGVLVQKILRAPFEIEATYVLTEGRTDSVEDMEEKLTGPSLDRRLDQSRKQFDQKFERVFALRKKGINERERLFARTALANILGGIGFFYGRSLKHADSVKSDRDIVQLNPVSLLTATPSRSSFPRGFLWDEGFHQLIIQRWDANLSSRCMQSWFETVQENGWIAREQVLGLEANSRFPEHVKHLMIQDPLVANPPTILMPLRLLTANGDDAHVWKGMIDKIMRYYNWLKRTQSGELPDSFRWRGRSQDVKSQDGYPLTLASGLDDYPRALTPSDMERHVDLHCWMTWACKSLAQLSEAAGEKGTAKQLWEEHLRLKKLLVTHHGSDVTADEPEREDLLLCDYDGDEKVCHEGYATILPLVLGLLDPSDVRVGAILDSLENPDALRAKAGVRSLSKSDKWHRKGDDYWTGSVWMPFNFLTLAALKTRYSVEQGPFKQRAHKLYKELRSTILENTFSAFVKTGQLWENYSPDDDGAGKSGRQFTGWSSLILLIYAEMFDGVL